MTVDTSPGRPFVAYAMQRFPSLRTTFIRREIEAIRAEGVAISTYSMRPADLAELQNEQQATPFLTTTGYLPDWPLGRTSLNANLRFLIHRPWRYLGSWRLLLANPGQPGLTSRLRVALQIWRGAVLADELNRTGHCRHIHAQFADGAATTAMVAARLLVLPFSFTSHTSEAPPALAEKLAAARFVVSISDYDKQQLISIGGKTIADKVTVVHCGIPLDQWPYRPRQPDDTPHLLSVGALIATKGHDTLIEACARLKAAGYRFRATIVGGGQLQDHLQQLIDSRGLTGQVTLTGPLPQAETRHYLYQADLFVLACRPARHGSEGIPVSLMEAMAAGLTTVSTRLSGIPELISHDRTGYLAEPGDSDSLFRQLVAALECPDRTALLTAARQRIELHFNQQTEAARLAVLYRSVLTPVCDGPDR